MSEELVTEGPVSESAVTDAAVGEVRALLAAAGLPASDAEIATFASGYREQRRAMDSLYAVPQVRYVDPALRFRAATRITDWSS